MSGGPAWRGMPSSFRGRSHEVEVLNIPPCVAPQRITQPQMSMVVENLCYTMTMNTDRNPEQRGQIQPHAGQEDSALPASIYRKSKGQSHRCDHMLFKVKVGVSLGGRDRKETQQGFEGLVIFCPRSASWLHEYQHS